MSHLSPCPSCQRHVRVDEGVCPFCSATLPESHRQAPAPRLPRRRMGRAALMAFGVTVGTGAMAAGCGDDGSTDAAMMIDGATGDAGFDAGGIDAAYGGPPVDAAMDDAAMDDAAMDAGGVDAAYGGPPTDAAMSDDAL